MYVCMYVNMKHVYIYKYKYKYIYLCVHVCLLTCKTIRFWSGTDSRLCFRKLQNLLGSQGWVTFWTCGVQPLRIDWRCNELPLRVGLWKPQTAPEFHTLNARLPEALRTELESMSQDGSPLDFFKVLTSGVFRTRLESDLSVS